MEIGSAKRLNRGYCRTMTLKRVVDSILCTRVKTMPDCLQKRASSQSLHILHQQARNVYTLHISSSISIASPHRKMGWDWTFDVLLDSSTPWTPYENLEFAST